MRLIKLAVRSVFEWRRLVAPSVATVLLVSALITVAGSVHEPIELEVRRVFRVRLGEYEGEMTTDSADRLIRAAESMDALVSVAAPPTAGVLDSIADLLLVRASFTDLVSELAFWELSGSLTAEVGEELSAGDAVLLAAGPAAEQLRGRVARLSTAGRPVLTQILAVAPMPEGGPVLLIHAPDPGDTVWVRVRGKTQPLDAAVLRAAGIAAAGKALDATDWLERASQRTSALARGVRVFVLVLASLAVATLIPGHLLLLDRAAPTFRLLLGWGFAPRDRGMVLVAMGGFASFVASGVGAAVGLAVASIMNAGEMSAIDLLPLDLASSLAAVMDAGVTGMVPPVTPAVGWAAACVLGSTLLGALTALPSARIAATLDSRG